jgi:hypothetical protein
LPSCLPIEMRRPVLCAQAARGVKSEWVGGAPARYLLAAKVQVEPGIVGAARDAMNFFPAVGNKAKVASVFSS